MKPYREQPTLRIVCPHCRRKFDMAIAKLQTVVGVICIGCHKSIPMTAEFVAAMRVIK